MNFLPEMEHVEVIIVAGMAALTMWVTVSTLVLSTVYFATRERRPKPAPAAAGKPIPVHEEEVTEERREKHSAYATV